MTNLRVITAYFENLWWLSSQRSWPSSIGALRRFLIFVIIPLHSYRINWCVQRYRFCSFSNKFLLGLFLVACITLSIISFFLLFLFLVPYNFFFAQFRCIRPFALLVLGILSQFYRCMRAFNSWVLSRMKVLCSSRLQIAFFSIGPAFNFNHCLMTYCHNPFKILISDCRTSFI